MDVTITARAELYRIWRFIACLSILSIPDVGMVRSNGLSKPKADFQFVSNAFRAGRSRGTARTE